MPRQVIFELSELKQTNAGDRKGGKDDWMADRVQLPRGLHNGYVTEQNTRNVTSKDLVSMPGFGSSWGDCDGSKEHESLDFDTVNTPFWVDSIFFIICPLLSIIYVYCWLLRLLPLVTHAHSRSLTTPKY